MDNHTDKRRFVLRSNILANLAGAAWFAALSLLATPVQLRLLGVEAFGLVGLIAVLQIVFSTLDFGLSTALTQAIAADQTRNREKSLPVANSAGLVYAIVAVILASVSWAAAGWVASNWVHARTLSDDVVIAAIRMIGFYLAIRFPIAFYTGVLNGIQRMDVLNGLKAAAVTVRIGGGLLVILFWPAILALIGWFAVAAIAELAAYAFVTHRLVPSLSLGHRGFSFTALKSIWRFTLTMAAISFLAMGITQVDRLIVSKLLSLSQLGYYTVAYTAAMAIGLLQTSINNAVLPALAQAGAKSQEELRRQYFLISRMTTLAIGLPCAALALFGHAILRLWVGPAVAGEAWLPLAILVGGYFFNGAVSTAYLAAVATRTVRISAIINLVSFICYVPLLLWLVPRWGLVGAASGWLLFNLSYLFTLLPAIHRRVLGIGVGHWLARAIGFTIVVAAISFGLGAALSFWAGSPAVTLASLTLATAGYLAIAYVPAVAALRQKA